MEEEASQLNQFHTSKYFCNCVRYNIVQLSIEQLTNSSVMGGTPSCGMMGLPKKEIYGTMEHVYKTTKPVKILYHVHPCHIIDKFSICYASLKMFLISIDFFSNSPSTQTSLLRFYFTKQYSL